MRILINLRRLGLDLLSVGAGIVAIATLVHFALRENLFYLAADNLNSIPAGVVHAVTSNPLNDPATAKIIGQEIQWLSSDTAVASVVVDSAGARVVGHRQGVATLFASLGSLTDSAKVTVAATPGTHGSASPPVLTPKTSKKIPDEVIRTITDSVRAQVERDQKSRSLWNLLFDIPVGLGGLGILAGLVCLVLGKRVPRPPERMKDGAKNIREWLDLFRGHKDG